MALMDVQGNGGDSEWFPKWTTAHTFSLHQFLCIFRALLFSNSTDGLILHVNHKH